MDQLPVGGLGIKCVMQSLTQPVETDGQAVVTDEQLIGSGVQTVETEEHATDTGDQHLETSQQPTSELLPVSVEGALDGGSDSAATTEIILELSAVPVEFVAPGEGKLDPYENAQEKKHVDCVTAVERKNIPPKKDRLEPLKIDMSRPPTCLMPLTSSQISLQCMECYIIFSDHKSRMRHLKQRHPVQYEQCMLGDALFACYVCDRHFTNSSELMLHQRAHTEKQPFKCPICREAFRRSSELTLHKKVHFGRHGYACSDCGKLCKTLTLLKYHCRTHTGERPYVCKECGKRYSMPKALQKHLLKHSPEGMETDGDGIIPLTKAQLKKNDCSTAVKYLCSVCKAPFKTVKTRLYHMKRKHSSCVTAPSNTTTTSAPLTGPQLKPGQPIVTQAPMGQPNYLHVEPHGPLQQVDNIDTEQIRKLIESLGNVQKVNQVVILGQVPPHGQPLDLHQLQGIGEPVQLRFMQPQLTELKQTDVGESKFLELEREKPQCDSGEDTITLEPVLSNEQMETCLHSETQEDASMVTTEDNGLTTEQNQMHVDLIPPQLLGEAGQTVDLENTMIQTEQMIDQRETVELGQTPEQSQTVLFELTPTLIPTLELEQTQTDQDGLISASSLPTIEFEPTTEHNPIVQGEKVCVPSLIPTAELELPPLQTDQQELFTVETSKEECPQIEQLGTSQVGVTAAQIETLTINHSHSFGEEGHTQQTEVQETAEKPLLKDESDKQCVLQTSCEGKDLSAPEEGKALNDQFASDKLLNNREVQPHTQTAQTVPPSETNKLPQSSQLPVHLMSVQEFVKVRKRKQSDNSIMQGKMQQKKVELKAKPTKQPRAKSAHLVVKFSPKEKQKKPSQISKLPQKEELIQDTGLTPVKTQPDKKVPLKQKACKEKKLKKPNSISQSKIKSPSVLCDSQVQQVLQAEEQVQQVNQGKKKVKRPKDVTSESHLEQIIEQELIAPPKPKKKKKQQQKITQDDQPKKLKAKKLSKSGRRRMKQSMITSPVSEHMLNPQIEQQSLLLLKGHKQPQLKVYKLDTSKAPQGQTEEASPIEFQTGLQQDQDTVPPQKKKGPKCKPLKLLAAGGKRKVGRPKKNQVALSILAPLKDTSCSSDTSPSKPKTNRKRKASKVETEGIITGSHPSLECKDCGERFSDVSSLQEHKVALHAVESPGLTYTNGNIFEGVLRSDLGQPPLKVTEEVTNNSSGQKSFGMQVASDWDIEVDMKEEGLKERGEQVSFPALNSSPTLPLAVALEGDQQEDMEKNIDKTTEGVESCSPIAPNSTPSDSRSQVPFSYLSKSVQTRVSERCSHLTPIVPLHCSSKAGNTKTESEGNINETSDAPIPTVYSSEKPVPTEDDIKEELLLEVDLVTVGDGEQPVEEPCEESSQNDRSSLQEHNRDPGLPAHSQTENVNITEKILNEQSKSCPSDQPDIKQEEEEILVQMRDVQKRGVSRKTALRGRRKGIGKKVFATRKSLGEGKKELEPEKETEECQVVYQLYSLTNDTEIKDEAEFTTHHSASSSLSLEIEVRSSSEQHMITLPSASCIPLLEESSEDQVVFELESVTTSVVEVLKTEDEDGMVTERAATDQDDRDNGQSPGIILERFLTSRQREATARQNGEADLGDPDVKLENTSDLVSVPPTSQATHRVEQRVRMYLFEQESSLVSNNPEVSQDNTQTQLHVEPSNSKQCIFYPVKEEDSQGERDVPALVVPGEAILNHPVDNLPMTHPALEECVVKRQKAVQSGIEINEYGEGELDIEQQETEDLVDFLLQSSDEESEVVECSDAHLDSEALIMACYQDSQNPTASHSNYLPNNIPTTEQQDTSGTTEESQKRSGYLKPIDYFSKYFGWDTWVEIAQCTNKVSHLSNPLTANEVAQFVGIHIAMGTLKFPSLKLYWQDLTRVPLVADTMTASRFSQLSRKLKLASTAPAGESVDTHELGHLGNTDTPMEGVNIRNPITASHIPTIPTYGTIRTDLDGSCHGPPSSHSPVSVKPTTQRSTILHCNGQRFENGQNLKIDPLWRVRTLLDRVQARCLMLRREGDHGIDQYPLPLTCSPINNTRPTLHSTVLVGSDSLILDFNLSVDLSNKEATVEKMVPKNGMVYLCKQELSTPTMLERLLEAGVHGAGKVGGARGQIGDEFVSSDGRLMLRRFELGFILSTVGKAQQNMASLIDNFDKAQKAASLNRDLRNLYRSPLSASAPTSWPQAVLWYLTDLALVNSWLQYRQEHSPLHEPLNLMGFRLEVSKALILSSGSDTQDSAPPHLPAQRILNPGTAPEPGLLQASTLPDTATRYDGSGHWPEQLEDGEGGRCRFGGCERVSRVRCLKCCVFLCISRNHNCFLSFHSQGSF